VGSCSPGARRLLISVLKVAIDINYEARWSPPDFAPLQTFMPDQAYTAVVGTRRWIVDLRLRRTHERLKAA
jgi:hypothetical protein